MISKVKDAVIAVEALPLSLKKCDLKQTQRTTGTSNMSAHDTYKRKKKTFYSDYIISKCTVSQLTLRHMHEIINNDKLRKCQRSMHIFFS